MRSLSSLSLLTGLLALLAVPARAQAVPQVILVEHFTNTRCSVCANRNPGFYANLEQQPAGTLHVAYHPSSPYQQCLFSQQNPTENDARTNHYGIYGSTPRLVLNGTVIPAGQNYATPALFAPYQSQMSPLAVQVALSRQGTDSLAATATVQTVAPAALNGLTLYVALVEDTVFYAAPNGEIIHRNVFRKSFTGTAPEPILPAASGGSVTVRRVVATSAAWALPRLYAIAMVQLSGGALVQAGASLRLGMALGVPAAAEMLAPTVYPNPVSETLRFATTAGATWQVLNALGQVVARGTGDAGEEALNMRGLAAGAYVLRVSGQRAVRLSKE